MISNCQQDKADLARRGWRTQLSRNSPSILRRDIYVSGSGGQIVARMQPPNLGIDTTLLFVP